MSAGCPSLLCVLDKKKKKEKKNVGEILAFKTVSASKSTQHPSADASWSALSSLAAAGFPPEAAIEAENNRANIA